MKLLRTAAIAAVLTAAGSAWAVNHVSIHHTPPDGAEEGYDVEIWGEALSSCINGCQSVYVKVTYVDPDGYDVIDHQKMLLTSGGVFGFTIPGEDVVFDELLYKIEATQYVCTLNGHRYSCTEHIDRWPASGFYSLPVE